jgi:hypothetical protein
MQLRKIAIERSRVAALHVQVVLAAEHDRTEPVPFRLIQVFADRELVRELGEHRFDWRRHGATLLRDIGHTLGSAVSCVLESEGVRPGK